MIALDSSVIVAALLSWHNRHEAAARAVERALSSKEGVLIPAHAVIEAFAVLTRLPAPHRLHPAVALELLRENFASVRLATLPARNVWPLVERLSLLGLGGGIAYDAVILDSASEAGATSLLTLNERDYDRLDSGMRISAP